MVVDLSHQLKAARQPASVATPQLVQRAWAGVLPCLMAPASLCLPEPGYYQDDEFGIRLEDVALVVEAKTKVNCH